MTQVSLFAIILLSWFFIAAPLGFSTADEATYPAPQLVTSQPPEIKLSRPDYLQPTSLPGLGTSIMRISDAATFGGGQR